MLTKRYISILIFSLSLTVYSFSCFANELSNLLNVDKLFNKRIVTTTDIPKHFQKITVTSSKDLYLAINSAHKNNGNTAIIIADGNYSIPETINIRASNVMLIGNITHPHKTVLTGNGMKATRYVDNLIRVSGDNFHIEGLTLEQAGNHLLQIADADSPTIRHVIFRDGYEQLLKVSHNAKNPSKQSSNGLVEHSLFYYSAGIGPNFYIGGIDAHAIQDWYIHHNFFKDIASPADHIAEHAIHIWNKSKNNTVNNNVIINSDRGIGFGMRTPNSVQGVNSNEGGMIKGNIIYHTDNHHPFADVGIILEDSPHTIIDNNIVILNHAYPHAIEFRFKSSHRIKISNNIVNKGIRPRNNARATLSNNLVKESNELQEHYLNK